MTVSYTHLDVYKRQVEMVLTAMIVIAVAAKVTDFLRVAVCRRIYPRVGRGNESGI